MSAEELAADIRGQIAKKMFVRPGPLEVRMSTETIKDLREHFLPQIERREPVLSPLIDGTPIVVDETLERGAAEVHYAVEGLA
jgi:hypothetical protein